MSRTHMSRLAVALTTAGTLVFTLGGLMTFTACSGAGAGKHAGHSASPSVSATETVQPAPAHGAGRPQSGSPLPGMPPVLDPNDLYAADRPNQLADTVRNFPPRVYVPNTESHTVSVIDPATYQVIETIKVGNQPQHVVPSWDLKTLWVNNDLGNTLTPIDPATGKAGPTVDVHDPYNLYFTPDGKYAVVMASADHELVFRDAHTMQAVKHMPVGCDGVNHADFSPDGRYFVVSCEFDGSLLKVDTEKMEIVGRQKLPRHHTMPQDVKISPDGRTWYIADMMSHGVWVLDGDAFTTPKLIPTGKGAHGLYVSRDSKYMYISNRGEGTITLWEFTPGGPDGGRIKTKWHLPGGGSPDMGGVSADGKVLWLSGRYNSEVYAIDTADGHLIARIKVGRGPHGLAVYPQPGRYSLGHTGIFR